MSKVKMTKMLLQASETGSLPEVEAALRAGADVSGHENLAIRQASKYGYIHIVRRLIEAGANIHALDGDALQLAAKNGHLHIINLLLACGAEANADDGLALHLAARAGHLEVVNLLLEAGAEVRSDHDMALRLAFVRANMDVVDALIVAGARLTSLFDDRPNKKALSLAQRVAAKTKKELRLMVVQKYAAVAECGFEAVMLLEDPADMLSLIYPGMNIDSIRAELDLMDALGLSAARKGDMWLAQHPRQQNTPSLGVS